MGARERKVGDGRKGMRKLDIYLPTSMECDSFFTCLSMSGIV